MEPTQERPRAAQPTRMTPKEALEQGRKVARESIRRDRLRVRNEGLKRLLEYLDIHLFDDLRLSELRRRRCFPDEAWAAFRSELGMEPKAYAIDKRLFGAAWLLRRTDLEILFIADFAGYSTTASFDAAFPKWARCLPGEYRRALQDDDVIKVVADEMESDEFWWKALFRLLSLEQARRLFDRLVTWYPFLDPRPKARKTWHLSPQVLAKPDLVYQAVWRAARRLPPELRVEMMRSQIACDAPAEFFHFLCGKSLEVGREEPERGVEVMELALEFLRGSAEELGDELRGLEAQGLARLANAHRLASDLGRAKRYLAEAREVWKSVENRDELVEAEVDFYEATLHLIQGNLGEARKLFDRAIGLCETKPPCRLLAQCLNQRSLVISYGGESEGAIRDLRAAEAVLAHLDEPRLKLTVAGNLALVHALGGQVAEAEEQLTRAWELCDEAGDEVIRQHLFWTQGLVHHARGELEAAASEFEKARKGFKKLHQPGYRAMVSLELALVRHEQRRFEDVVELAATAVPVLEHFRYVSGVTLALRTLREAVAAQQVGREVLEKVRTELYALWRDPDVDLDAVKA